MGLIPGLRRSPRGGHGICSRILALRIPWTGILGDYSPHGHTESDTTDATEHECRATLKWDGCRMCDCDSGSWWFNELMRKSTGWGEVGCAGCVFKQAAFLVCPWCHIVSYLNIKTLVPSQCHYNKLIILCLRIFQSCIQLSFERHPWFSIKIQFVDLCISGWDFRDHFKKSKALFFETWFFEKPDPLGTHTGLQIWLLFPLKYINFLG